MFYIEKNEPATFARPRRSLTGDYKMMFCVLTGKINREVERVSKK